MGGRGKLNSILVVQSLLKNFVICLIMSCYMKYFVIVFLNYFTRGWREDKWKSIEFFLVVLSIPKQLEVKPLLSELHFK